MPRESVNKKLERVRPPRVHISYEVEVGNAIELKELPFVMGVLGDFTGQPEEPLARLKDRKFVDISLDNFDSVLASMKPHLAFTVENKLSEDPEAGKIGVNLRFQSMDDFEPANVARQVGPLRELLEMRQRLTQLLNKMEGNDKLEQLLGDVLSNTEKAMALAKQMGLEAEASGAEAPKPEETK